MRSMTRSKQGPALPFYTKGASKQDQQFPIDPVEFAIAHLHFTPDPRQCALLREHSLRVIMNCCRQYGKSTVTAVKATHFAVNNPGSLIIIASYAARQSAELVRKIEKFLHLAKISTCRDGANEISLVLPNGTRIVGLPGKDDSMRGFSAVNLLIIDEAARVPDNIYFALRPTIAAAENGQIWILSTPAGRRGFFYDAFTGSQNWTRIEVPATECPRIPAAFLEEERQSMGDPIFSQEYLCQFIDSSENLFTASQFDDCLVPMPPIPFHPHRHAVQAPLIRDEKLRTEIHYLLNAIPRPPLDRTHYIGLDLGQKQSYTALAIIERATVITGEQNRVTYEYPTERRFVLRHLERYPLDTPYTDVIDNVCRLIRHPELSDQRAIALDAGGPGGSFIDSFRKARPNCRITGVTITSGSAITRTGDNYRVPRTELLTLLRQAILSRSLLISDTMPDAHHLRHELLNFDLDLQSRQTTDLVFACAFAYWRANLYEKGI